MAARNETVNITPPTGRAIQHCFLANMNGIGSF